MQAEIFYIIAATLFIVGLKMLNSPETAKQGNLVSATGMLVAVLTTLLSPQIQSYQWILYSLIIGALVGIVWVRFAKMTDMPQMVAIFNGFGGLASLLIAGAELVGNSPTHWAALFAIYITAIVGSLTFSGSLVAFLKLAEIIPTRIMRLPGQFWVNSLLYAAVVVQLLLFISNVVPFSADQKNMLFLSAIVYTLIIGLLAVSAIGGADMPVVISFLNSCSGLAACAAGFVILNSVLVVAGALVGASGFILTSIMCKAMNRSLRHVLFVGFSKTKQSTTASATIQGEVRPINVQDAYLILEAASSVVIIPGYGMAVAQAQHAVRELGELLEQNGAEIRYAIHPVAGRMPGHMNVLLAEANVPYEQQFEPKDVNPIMESVDVCIIVGANDVVNPLARDVESSPIYGMPILEADRAKTVFILKRSMASGFAGVDNPLFFSPNTRMLFGDAKASAAALAAEFKA